MDTMDFSVPEEFRTFVQNRVAEGGFGSASDYLQQLIEADKIRQARSCLEAELLKGIESGPVEPMTEEDWQSIRDEVRNRIEARINKAV
jgi:antitoxin ParD1/3/4